MLIPEGGEEVFGLFEGVIRLFMPVAFVAGVFVAFLAFLV
jgi:hypothetical protein